MGYAGHVPMSAELEPLNPQHRAELEGRAVTIAAPIALSDVPALAEVADRLFTAGKVAWVCAACGARAVRWQLDPEPQELVLAAIAETHANRSKVCSTPDIRILDEGVDLTVLLGTPASAIAAKALPGKFPGD